MWDVRRAVLVAVYGEHFGRLLSVEWSATDADVVLSGSDDHTVHAWHISQHHWNDGELDKLMSLGLCASVVITREMCSLYVETK